MADTFTRQSGVPASHPQRARSEVHSGRLMLALWALVFGAVFHWSYVSYTSQAFAYATFTYEDPSLERMIFSYVATVIPLLRYEPRSRLAANYLAAVIYVSVYIPLILGSAFMWRSRGSDLTMVQLFVMLSMTILFGVAKIGISNKKLSLPLPPTMVDYAIMFFTTINVVAIVLIVGADFQIVAFSDVYEQRFRTSPLVQNPLFSYSFAWQTAFFTPYLIAIGMARRQALPIGVGLVGAIVTYGAFADKIAILMPALIVLMRIARGRDFLRVLLASASGAVVVATAITATTGWFFQLKSLVLIRTVSVPGWTVTRYFEYFSENGYTYWSHFRPLNGVFTSYPYGERSLGEVIGIWVSGDPRSNWNANFWASDGIAAAGAEGLLVLLPVLCLLLLAINYLGQGVEPRFFATLLTGFMVSLANAPLTTSLLTGGLALIIVMRFGLQLLVPRRSRGAEPPRSGGVSSGRS